MELFSAVISVVWCWVVINLIQSVLYRLYDQVKHVKYHHIVLLYFFKQRNVITSL